MISQHDLNRASDPRTFTPTPSRTCSVDWADAVGIMGVLIFVVVFAFGIGRHLQ